MILPIILEPCEWKNSALVDYSHRIPETEEDLQRIQNQSEIERQVQFGLGKRLSDLFRKPVSNPSTKLLKIFLAATSELKEERIEFELFIGRQNKIYVSKGKFIELVIWEDFLDTATSDRVSSEFNKAIQDCESKRLQRAIVIRIAVM